MMKKVILTILMFSLCACSSGAESTAEPSASAADSFSEFFDTVEDYQGDFVPPLNTTIKLTMDSQEELDEVYDGTAEIIDRYHKILEAYHYYRDDDGTILMNLAQMNEYLASEGSVQVSAEMIDALQEAVRMMKLSDGYFNPFLGELINVWGSRFSNFPVEGTDPDQEEIDQALGCILTPDTVDDQFSIDEASGTVSLSVSEECRGHVSINLGAFAKGYIQDLCRQYLDPIGYHYLLNIGTSNITGISADPIRIGVRSPYSRVKTMYAVGLESGMALSTSGDDSNYFLLVNEDGTKTIRSHILNPETGYSENYYRNVTVISESATVCDVLSTALFNIKDTDEINQVISAFEEEYGISVSYGLLEETDAEKELCDLHASKSFVQYMLDDYTAENLISVETEES